MLSLDDTVGLIGVFCAIYSYGRVQWHRDYAKTFSYSILNLLSAVFLLFSLSHQFNLASFISNAIWGVISLYGLWRCYRYAMQTQTSAK